jgi:hypothetical protein
MELEFYDKLEEEKSGNIDVYGYSISYLFCHFLASCKKMGCTYWKS